MVHSLVSSEEIHDAKPVMVFCKETQDHKLQCAIIGPKS